MKWNQWIKIKCRISSNCLKDTRKLIVSGFLRPSMTKGNIEQFKTRLMAKGFIQKEDIDHQETFSHISQKDSLRIILALVAHYDLELHQMDVKTAFLNGSLGENVYMDQLEGFSIKGKEHLACKLKMSIYGLKQASWQWYPCERLRPGPFFWVLSQTHVNGWSVLLPLKMEVRLIIFFPLN